MDAEHAERAENAVTAVREGLPKGNLLLDLCVSALKKYFTARMPLK